MAIICGAALAGIATFAAAKSINEQDTSILAPASVNQINKLKSGAVADEIIVKFKGVGKGFKVIKTAAGETAQEITRYRKRTDVEYAEPNYIAYALSAPNDPYYRYQWNFGLPENGGINMENAWNISAGDSSVIVAVVDTGIAYEAYGSFCKAPDLGSTNFASGYNFVNNTVHANDDNGHGTHVSGTIAQSTNNAVGVAGIAYNTTLMPVKVLDSAGSGSYANVSNGIIYAADHGAKVINLSLGGGSPSDALLSAVKYAHDKGATVVAACGNDSANNCSYPAAYSDYVISVGATRYDKALAPYSNNGANLNIVAPGGDMTVDQNNDGSVDGILQQTFAGSSKTCSFGYYFYQGTSMATPHISGIAALLIAKGNATAPDQVKTAIDSTAKDLGTAGRDDTYGYGLADAYAALQWTDKPQCTGNSECDNGIYCDGAETCQSGKCVSANAVDCSALNDICNSGICSETNKACVLQPKPNGTSCSDSLYCNGAETCQSGSCAAGTAIACNDSNNCTTDTCSESAKACSYTAKSDNTPCPSGICCAGACKVNATTCAATACWAASNKFILPSTAQFQKFCKCAQGTYAYKSYKSSLGRNTVWKYNDTANNTTWTVSSSTSLSSASSVTCNDNKAYPTNQSYSR